MNEVVVFETLKGKCEALHVDRRGRYYLAGKPATIARAFGWYAAKSSSPATGGASSNYQRQGRFLRKVAALLK